MVTDEYATHYSLDVNTAQSAASLHWATNMYSALPCYIIKSHSTRTVHRALAA